MKPIIMSAESVRAILDGRKTQTRRVIKPQPEPFLDTKTKMVWSYHHRAVYGTYAEMAEFMRLHSPYTVGQRLWVRETWNARDVVYDEYCGGYEAGYPLNPMPRTRPEYRYVIDFKATDGDEGPWRSPIFMPHWASRITLEVTGVRAERLQEITEADVDAEGFNGDFPGRAFPSVFTGDWDYYGQFSMPECYGILWDSINGKRYPWDSNPWVWVVEFAVAGGDR